jgi:hypothetical protein
LILRHTVIFVGKWDWFLFTVLPVSHQQSPIIFAHEYGDRTGGKNFVDLWLDWAIFHGNSAVIGQNCKPAFDWTLLCAKCAGIGQNCKLSNNMRRLVDFCIE